MSCYLYITGTKFDIDAFITKSKLSYSSKRYKGQPKFETKPTGEKLLRSSLSMQTSSADFNDLEKQIKDTIAYLKRNYEKLDHISSTKEIQWAVLNFGIDLRIDKKNVFSQSDMFPNKLLKLAGNLGLDIELSIYPIDFDNIVAKKYKQKKK